LNAGTQKKAGCFSIVLEAIPAALAKKITSRLTIPTIGIGAGPDVDGQVLVLQDMLGLTAAFKPRFLRTWLAGTQLIRSALDAYHDDVLSGNFPTREESYS